MIPDAGDLFIICFNPGQAVRDAAVREKMITALEEMIAGSDKLTVTKRAELRGKISTVPGLNRFLRVTPGGLLRHDWARPKSESIRMPSGTRSASPSRGDPATGWPSAGRSPASLYESAGTRPAHRAYTR